MSAFWIDVIVAVHVMIALAIIGLVLLQHGKGADMGSGFGGGASGSLFGASGSANFLSRTTAVLAALFFASSLGLAYLAGSKPRERSVLDSTRQQAPAKTAPAVPGSAPAAPAKPAPAAPGSKANEVPR